MKRDLYNKVINKPFQPDRIKTLKSFDHFEKDTSHSVDELAKVSNSFGRFNFLAPERTESLSSEIEDVEDSRKAA